MTINILQKKSAKKNKHTSPKKKLQNHIIVHFYRKEFFYLYKVNKNN